MDYLQFVRRLLREIDEEVASLDHAIVQGQPQDWAAYRETVAERRGLMKARSFCTGRLKDDDKRELLTFPN